MNSRRKQSRRDERRRILLAMDIGQAGLRHIGIAQYAKEAGWIVDSGLFAMFPCNIHQAYLEAIEFDGILSSIQRSQPELRRIVEGAGVPVVDLGQNYLDLTLPRVFPNHYAAGRLSAQHLVELGLRRLAFYSHVIDHPAAQTRCKGFRDAAHQLGIEVKELWWDGTQNKRSSSRLNWLVGELRSFRRPFGVMAQNDFVATDVLDASFRAGLRVPEDVAVIGVDNDVVASELGPIPLTSVDMARAHVGYEAAALLDRLMRGEKPPKDPVLVEPAGVVVRQSTQMLAVSDPDLADAVRFIRENFRKPITVADVAAHTFLSRRRLQDRFYETFGHGMNDEIARQRIDLCKSLLTQTTHKISIIALMAGFGDVNRMGKTFKRKLRMTPDEYRQQYQPAFVPRPAELTPQGRIGIT